MVRAAVDGVVQVHVVEAELIGGLDADGDFFDGAGAIIAAGAVDRDLRRLRFVGGDEVVLGEAHRLALVDGGDVIRAVLLHVDRALVVVAVAAGEMDRLAAVERELAIAAGAIHLDFDLRVGAFDRAQIAGVLLRHRLQAGPLGIVIGDVNLLHRRQIDHAHLVVRRNERPGRHVVLDVLRQAGENKLVARAAAESGAACMVTGSHPAALW